jgi:hypothetical protein
LRYMPLIPPRIATKEFVTADHIGEGRFGLNVVCGWNEDEFEMFGARLRDHEARYDTRRNGSISSSWLGRRRRNSISMGVSSN